MPQFHQLQQEMSIYIMHQVVMIAHLDRQKLEPGMCCGAAQMSMESNHTSCLLLGCLLKIVTVCVVPFHMMSVHFSA